MTNLKVPVGLQLYTLRNETLNDFIGTLKKVADMGYETVEFAGYGDLKAPEMKRVLDDLGLQAVSSHLTVHQLQTDLHKQIEYIQEIGGSFVVCPWVDPLKLKDEEEFQALLTSFRSIGAVCKENGLTFAYHNHAFEFEQVNGEAILDRIFQGVDRDLLEVELDLFWVQKAELNPVDYLRKYSGRIPIMHVKDMASEEVEGSFAEVGYGIMDYPALFAEAAKAGVQYYMVEQDKCKRPPLESVKMSIDYLRTIGIAQNVRNPVL